MTFRTADATGQYESVPLISPSDFGFLLTDADVVVANAPDGEAIAIVCRISPDMLDICPVMSSDLETGRPMPVFLRSPGMTIGPLRYFATEGAPIGSIRVQLADRNMDSDREILRLVTERIGTGAVESACATPHHVDVITEPERITSILGALFASGCRVHVKEESGASARALTYGLLGTDRRLLLEWNPGVPAIMPPFDLHVSCNYVDYRLRVERQHLDGKRIVGQPEWIERSRLRTERRLQAPPRAQVRAAHPLWPHVRILRPIIDVSFKGICFVSEPTEDLLYPGLRLEDVEVTWKAGPRVHFSAEVRHISPAINHTGHACGLSLHPRTPEDEALWRREVGQLLYPATKLGFSWGDPLWELYDKSGYFGLSGMLEPHFVHLRDDFRLASDKLAKAIDLGYQVVSLSTGRIEASLAVLKTWQRAWITYQLARYPQGGPLALSGNAVLLDLYLHAYEQANRDPDLRWHVVYIRKDARFSRLLHYNFTAARADDELASVVPFRCMEKMLRATPPPPPLPDNLSAGLATEAECYLLLRKAQTMLPMPYLEAKDLVADRLNETRLTQIWRDADLHRQREIIAIRKGGTPIAAAVVDIVESGLHLYGLVDQVHVFPFGAEGEANLTHLLHEVERWYRVQDHWHYILIELSGNDRYATDAGLVNIGDADATIMHVSYGPQFLEYLFEITAPDTTDNVTRMASRRPGPA